jgi:hypothetical protein
MGRLPALCDPYSTASSHATVRRSRLLLCASITAPMVRSVCSGVTSSAAFFSMCAEIGTGRQADLATVKATHGILRGPATGA